jgi:hypothetical protein
MLNSKIVNVYLENDSSKPVEYIRLDKLQIEISLEEGSRVSYLILDASSKYSPILSLDFNF